MKRIAVIGSGISGLAAAYFLSRRHEVSLFERADRLGGHTNTIVVDSEQGSVALDTGFLVHNDRTYPNLVRLFREIGVETRDSDMSFSVACRRTGLEYSSRGPRGFFATPRTLVSSTQYRLLGEIVRFNREAPAVLTAADSSLTLGDFLESRGFGEPFVSCYLLPMASAIWSAALASIRQFPAATLVRFFDNHGLLSLTGAPMWKVVANGSRTYIPKLAASLADRVFTGASIAYVARDDHRVRIAFHDRSTLAFDEVVFACHGDQVLPLLADASDAERDVFSLFRTTRNEAWLHTDAGILPARSAARASWNYVLGDEPGAPPTLTYDLNRLQRLTTSTQYCVTLNPDGSIDDRRLLRRISYRHPLFDRDAIRAQGLWRTVSGRRRTHFCGAYWFYGFHEDGLRSALRVAGDLGVAW